MKITDPYLGVCISAAALAVFYASFNYFVYCMVYVRVWSLFQNAKPFTDRHTIPSRWRYCRISPASSAIAAGTGTDGRFHIQLTDSTINVIYWWWIVPFVSRFLEMAVVPMNEVRIVSPRELILLCNSENPFRVCLDEPLWEPSFKQQT